MRATLLFWAVALTASLSVLGCDIASDPLPAYARIEKPTASQTITVGEPFRLQAAIEAESPVDSIIVRVQPRRSGTEALQFRLAVPPALQARSGEGNLKGLVAADLVVDRLLIEGVTEHLLTLRTYLQNGRVGGSSGIPLQVQPAE